MMMIFVVGPIVSICVLGDFAFVPGFMIYFCFLILAWQSSILLGKENYIYITSDDDDFCGSAHCVNLCVRGF